MVIVLRKNIHSDEKNELKGYLESHGYHVREIAGEQETIFGAVGPASLDIRDVEVLPGVSQVIPISKPYKLASREFKPDDSIVNVGDIRIGGGRVAIIAGPCAVESREQILEIASQVREAGAVILRGGAFKPRTSPYSFQGLGEEGLAYLKEAGEKNSMPVVSEIVSPQQLDMMSDYVDMFQIGARNMQNFELLKAVGAGGKPVLLNRGLAARIEEWLMAAEYLMAHGCDDVVLCERGIRTFETYTQNSLDLSSIPVVKKLSHIPILVDPSHATGIREKVMPMGIASIAAGADGIMVEVHSNPEQARSDGAQSLYPDQFEKLVRDVEALCPVLHLELARLPLPQVIHSDFPSGASTGLSIAFQGEAGAYSEIALHKFFDGKSAEFSDTPCARFADVFERVLSSADRYAVLPIENALTGSIHENYDLLLQYPDIRICGETRIRIQHSLIGTPDADLEDVEVVMSHPQGLAQSSRFLSEHPGIEQKPFYDTAGSVAEVKKLADKRYAAIAGSAAAQVYGMKVLVEGIETNPVNYTRFVVIKHADDESTFHTQPQKASIVFSVADKPGALLKCMEVLSSRSLNLQKIESRPIHGKPWEYMFYLDVDIENKEDQFVSAVEELKEYSEDVRVLGIYARG